jgi:hypothetical protein
VATGSTRQKGGLKRSLATRRARYPVGWAHAGRLSRAIADRRLVPPPVLVLSMPRSGSSWVGATLGAAANACYLREPITHVWSRMQVQPAVIEIDPGAPRPRYAEIADVAFRGVPRFSRDVVSDPGQWRAGAGGKRLVVKEVNPLALRWFTAAYQPFLIYLVRHPAAVAHSLVRQGWPTDGYGELFTQARQDSGELREDEVGPGVWARLGALQAVALNDAVDALDEAQIVAYEDLCASPTEAFRDLFARAGLVWDDRVAGQLRAQPADAWRTGVAADDLAEIRRGYALFDPPLYRDDW